MHLGLTNSIIKINVSSHIAMELISSIDKIAGATCKYLISVE